MNVVSLTQAVKDEARRLDFNLVGVTLPDPPPHYAEFERWLELGRHGEMGYLETGRSRLRRSDPRQILPDCRSILVLGMRYTSPEIEDDLASSQDGAALHGRVAAYAWGDDYHDLFAGKLKTLTAFIDEQVGEPVPNRWYTDTGPILERDLAQRAGLGWIGKNTMLINPQSGSYYLLAEILLGVDLEPDPPFLADRCGTCTRCIDACPTQCILPDRTLDARRCISYLTIELKGPISPDLRPLMGSWIFGCDICQEVCPWNRRIPTPGDPSNPAEVFSVRLRAGSPSLIDEISLTPEEFNLKYKGSPVQRSKRRGYLRNVAVALGNSGSPAAVPALTHALLKDPEPLVRSHAAWALGRIGGPAARQALLEASRLEDGPAVSAETQAEIQAALASIDRQPA